MAGNVRLPMTFGIGAGAPVTVEHGVVGNDGTIDSERWIGVAGEPAVGVAAAVAVAGAVKALAVASVVAMAVVAVVADAVAGQVVAAEG